VTASVDSPINLSTCRDPGSIDQPTSCPWVLATIRSTGPLRRTGAIAARGAAAPNQMVLAPKSEASLLARAARSGVGSSISVGTRSTRYGRVASYSTDSAPRNVDASTATSSGSKCAR